MKITRWHTFNMDEYLGPVHYTYRGAVEAAQNSLGSNRRPKRTRPGFYELKGEINHQGRRRVFYIATTAAAVLEGWPNFDQWIA